MSSTTAATHRHKKKWEDGVTRKIVVPPEHYDFPKVTTIAEVANAYGFSALIACPDSPPEGNLGSGTPSSSKKPANLQKVVSIEGEDLWTPPSEFMDLDISAFATRFAVASSGIQPAPDWRENSLTTSHLGIHNACIEGLTAVVGREGKASPQARVRRGEVDMVLTLLAADDESGPEACFYWEMKRPDSAYQATFGKEPWVPNTNRVSHHINWTMTTAGILAQIESYVRPKGRMGDVAGVSYGVMAIPPARLHVFGFGEDEAVCTVGVNAIPACDPLNSRVLTSPEFWTKYYSCTLWVCFVWLVAVSDDFAQEWGCAFGEQGLALVERARQVKKSHYLWASISWLLLLFLPTKIVLHFAHQLHEHSLNDTILFNKRPFFSFGSLCLSDGECIRNDSTRVYIYRQFEIVIKVFDDSSDAFQRELLAYEACKDLQGDVLPFLYGFGRLESDHQRILVTSYAGEAVDHLTPEIVKQVWKGPLDALHKIVHHHDLWEGNILVSQNGKLKLIDFGRAVPKGMCTDRSKCPDYQMYAQWKAA
ncbi:hypothetical protein BKA70DRAFT_1430615 [Coprinopsis sp. MPI-PUGE-AT-0042]|nr:hypothetical protein BKA70DRAFT_1430615 [Coprinopsis sp. MPI-PUGE-AT-0042]